MIPDPIVEEVRRARNAHAAKFNYDLDAIAADLRAKSRASGRTYVSFDEKADPQELGQNVVNRASEVTAAK